MKEFGKKQVVVVALVVMIGIAGYINWSYKNKEDSIPATVSYDDLDLSDYASAEDEYYVPAGSGESKVDVDADTAEDDLSVSTVFAESNYFTVARVEKQKARSEAVEIYTDLLNNENSSAGAKEKAETDISAVAQNTETEAIIENLIKAKGFEEAIVYLTGDEAKVVVKTKGLVPAQVAQIKDLIMENAKILADKIKIVEIF